MFIERVSNLEKCLVGDKLDVDIALTQNDYLQITQERGKPPYIQLRGEGFALPLYHRVWDSARLERLEGKLCREEVYTFGEEGFYPGRPKHKGDLVLFSSTQDLSQEERHTRCVNFLDREVKRERLRYEALVSCGRRMRQDLVLQFVHEARAQDAALIEQIEGKERWYNFSRKRKGVERVDRGAMRYFAWQIVEMFSEPMREWMVVEGVREADKAYREVGVLAQFGMRRMQSAYEMGVERVALDVDVQDLHNLVVHVVENIWERMKVKENI